MHKSKSNTVNKVSLIILIFFLYISNGLFTGDGLWPILKAQSLIKMIELSEKIN